MSSRSKRSYTYRIPADHTAALLRLRRFQRKSEYWIDELPDRKVPNVNAVKNWGCLFYRSKETHGDYLDEFEGGAIPGLEEYRHSLDWKPTPETELLEMKRASGGGTKIRGEQFLGTSDPRLSDYIHIETTVPWTIGEIRSMFDGEPVPDKKNYHHDPPEIDASEAREQYQHLIDMAIEDGFKEAREALREYERNCDHDHVVKDDSGRMFSAWCEDCGRNWENKRDMEADEVRIVGTA